MEQADAADERFARVRARADALISNIGAVETGMSESFALNEQNEQLREELTTMRRRLAQILTPLIDDQIFYLITGYSLIGEANAAREDHFSEEEFSRYRHLEILRTEANVATELLANSYVVSDASFVEPLRERFESAQSRIERSLFALVDAPFYAETFPNLRAVIRIGKRV